MPLVLGGVIEPGYFWAIAAAVFWSLAVVLFRRAGEVASPPALNIFKNLVALACFAPFVLIASSSRLPDWSPQDWLLVAISGVVGITVADTMFFAALNRLGAGLNAVVNCLYFPSLALQAYLFLGRPVSPQALAGGLLVIAAILLGAAGGPLPGTSRRDLGVGVVIAAGGVMVVGLGVILIDSLLDRSPVLFTTAVRLAFGMLALLPVLLIRPVRLELRGLLVPSAWWRIAVPASVLGTALAMWAWLKGFAESDNVAAIAVLNELSTVFVFLLATVVLGEPLTVRRSLAVVLGFAGAALVLA